MALYHLVSKDFLTDGAKIQKLTPSIGSEITGVQLSKLNPAGKDQLALNIQRYGYGWSFHSVDQITYGSPRSVNIISNGICGTHGSWTVEL